MGPSVHIEFAAQQNPVFGPGEKITGNVVVNNITNEKINGITIKFSGKSRNRWYDPMYKAVAQQKECYVDEKITLWPQQGTSSMHLHGDCHRLPFSFVVPENIPCSFEGCHGWVRYALYANLDIPFHSKIQKMLLTVLANADLNLDERAKLLPELSVSEDVGLLNPKRILIKAACNKGGYVPGELIAVTLDIQNNSDKDISKIGIILEQKATFYGKLIVSKRKKVDIRKAATVKEKNAIKGHSQQVWSTNMRVPSLPPSDLPGCNIIDMKYRLQITLKCDTFSKISFKLPFVIGSKPLKDASGDLFENLPSYVESVFGFVNGTESDDEEIMQGKEYSPLYPFYGH